MKPRAERLGNALGAVASVWFAFTAWWGAFQVPASGHIGAGAAATTMLAEASNTWHTLYPLFDWYAAKDPYPVAAYCHHPFGMYWLSMLALRVFGHQNIVVVLPAAVMSTLTVPLLYATGKRAWGPLPGAGAALGFAFLPITAGFSNFHNLEVMVIFGVVLFFYGHLRYQATKRGGDLLLSLVGACFAVSGDWVGYLIMAPLLGFAFARLWLVPGLTPRLDRWAYARWWSWSVCIAVASFVFWVAAFKHADKLEDWLSSANSRSGADVPLEKVLEARKAWIEFSFTPLAIWLGKLAAWVALVRFAVRRRDEEMFSLAALFGAVVQYIAFKRGADVHIFWPHYFGLYYAFALAQLVASAEWIGWSLTAWVAPMRASLVGVASAAVVLLAPTVLLVPDTARALKIWRETGGKYDDNGTLLRSNTDMLVVVQQLLAPHLSPNESVGYHGASGWGWEHQWALGGPAAGADAPTSNQPFWIARASGLGAERMADLSKKVHLRIYGDIVVVTRGDPRAPPDSYSLGEHEPNLLAWVFRDNVEPTRELGRTPDGWSTWEWRVHLDQPAEPPALAPSTLEEKRIAHNVAVWRGDTGEADRLLGALRGELTRDPETHYEGDHELMGVRVTHGVKPTLEIWFLAGGPTSADTTFAVRSSVVKKNPLSLVPVDTIDREMAWPPALSSKLWKKGFVYKFEVVLNHRIGLERYFGSWRSGPAAKRHAGDGRIDLAYLP